MYTQVISTQNKMIQDDFLYKFEQSLDQKNESPLLQRLRRNSWDELRALGLPEERSELFQYVPLKDLYRQSFHRAAMPNVSLERIKKSIFTECADSYILFVNGHFRPDLSCVTSLPRQIVVTTLTQAAKTFGAYIHGSFTKSIKEEHDPFALLNKALHQEGAFIYVPQNVMSQTPLHVIHLVDVHDIGSWIMPRLEVFVGKSSELHLVSSVVWDSGSQYFFNQLTHVNLEENAQASIIQCDIGSHSEKAWVCEAMRVEQKKMSCAKIVHVTDDTLTRRDYKSMLCGEGADVSLNGVWILDKEKQAHTNVLVEHLEPNCRSMQLFKGVLSDSSRSSFQGKIKVHQKAQKTEAYQLNKNLLLSPKCIANSKPNLEIHADDVKASHGATVGQLSQEEIFYLQTRGFNEIDAKNMLINGFCQEVLDLLFLPSLRKTAQKCIESYASL